MDNTYIVYKLTSPSGKCYIGMSKHSIEYRIKVHINDRRRAISKGKPLSRFYSAWIKYPIEQWTKEILYYDLSRDLACEMEKKEIINYKATNTTFGYNMADGGTGGLIGIGQLGKTWKVSDTTNMKLACHQFYTSDKWYASKSERAAKFKGRCNYQYKGDIITPWGIFETIISCTTAAKSIRQINKNMNVITDNSTLKKYITNLDTPLNSSGGRTPVEWRGQTPRCLGFNFISNNKEIS